MFLPVLLFYLCATFVESLDAERGAIARQKCAEYSQYSYAFDNKTAMNVSICGIRAEGLIPRGIKPDLKEFPHMTAVGYNMKISGIAWLCSGTLISESFVLTAAHCTYTRQWGDAAWVRVGDFNLKRSDDGAEPEDRRITERIRHPDYEPPFQYHDIALLRLESQVPFNAWIKPACLHTSPSTETERAIATGWGHADWAEDEDSGDLQKIMLPLIDSEGCSVSWSSGHTSYRPLNEGVLSEFMICAGGNNSDECQGDSGGPLVIYSKPEYYCMYDLIGVTSIGKLCFSRQPGIYTRVYNYVPWIETIVWGQT